MNEGQLNQEVKAVADKLLDQLKGKPGVNAFILYVDLDDSRLLRMYGTSGELVSMAVDGASEVVEAVCEKTGLSKLEVMQRYGGMPQMAADLLKGLMGNHEINDTPTPASQQSLAGPSLTEQLTKSIKLVKPL